MFSPKYTAINTGVNVVGFFVVVYLVSLENDGRSFLLGSLVTVGFISSPGLLLTLLATFSNQCNCCCSCCSCCTEPFEFGALLTSAPQSPCVLGSDGQLRRVETDGGLEEEMESMVEELEEVLMKNIEEEEEG